MQDSLQALSDSLEIAALQSQVEMMDAHYTALQETIYWAVGGVLALAALIAGVNIFLGAKAFSREKASMQAELEGVVAKRLSDAESSLHATVASSSEKLEDQVQDSLKKLEESLGAKLDSKSKDLNYKIDYQVKSVRSELHALQLELTMTEARELLESGRTGYSLYVLAKAVELTCTAQYGFSELSDVIDKINKVLDGIDSSDISANAATKLITALEKVDGEYAHEADIVKDRIRQIRSAIPSAS